MFKRYRIELDPFEWEGTDIVISGRVCGIPVEIAVEFRNLDWVHRASLLDMTGMEDRFSESASIPLAGNKVQWGARRAFASVLRIATGGFGWSEDCPDEDDLSLERDLIERLNAIVVLKEHARSKTSFGWDQPPLLPGETERDRRRLLKGLEREGYLERTDRLKAGHSPGLSYRLASDWKEKIQETYGLTI